MSQDVVIREEPRPWWRGFTLLSGRHIIVFRPWRHWDPHVTLIQAFVTPDSSAHLCEADLPELRLTHEILVEHGYAPSHLLRGAIVDRETGETNIRFLSADMDDRQTRYLCVDVTIPSIDSESTEVLSMVVTAHELLALPGREQAIFLDASSDGHGRGLVILSTSEPGSDSDDDPLVVCKISVDASGEHCTAVASEPSKLDAQDVFQFKHSCVFDGVRGRICHDSEACSNFYDLVVLNLN